jgi:DNA polymerase-3 subunit delta'
MENSIDNLLLHPRTRLQLELVLKDAPGSLLLSAVSGSGKKTIAKTIAAQMLQIPKDKKVGEYHYFFHVRRAKNKSDVSIEQIRGVIGSLKLKVAGSQSIKRVVFIEDAQFLSIPAQNALLKNLEEPGSDTVFILTVDSIQNILPTISSRTQIVNVQPVALNDALEFWNNRYESVNIESSWRLSGGSVGLMQALLDEATEHPLKKSIDDAKQFIKASKYQRIMLADQMSRNKDQFKLFLDAMGRTLSFLQQPAIRNNRNAQSNNILASRKAISDSLKALDLNVNSRLVALKLVMSLKI